MDCSPGWVMQLACCMQPAEWKALDNSQRTLTSGVDISHCLSRHVMQPVAQQLPAKQLRSEPTQARLLQAKKSHEKPAAYSSIWQNSLVLQAEMILQAPREQSIGLHMFGKT